VPGSRSAFVVDRGSYGFFADGVPVELKVAGAEEPSFVRVDGLTAPLQFFRTRVTAVGSGVQTEHVVVSAYYPALESDALARAVALLLPVCGPAALTIVVADKQGWAKASRFSDVPADAVAASVAYTKASGGWDESDPILVDVDGSTFTISARFENGRWELGVTDESGGT
jgi:hypothetical protein